MLLTVIHAVVKSKQDSAVYSDYLTPSLSVGTQLTFERIERGFPSIESDLHGIVNAVEIIRLARRVEQDGAQGIFVNCFDDPGVYAARELLRIPIYGAYQPAMLTAMGLADRVGVITTDRPGILSEYRKASLNGYEKRLASVQAVDMDVLSLMQNPDLLEDKIAQSCIEMYEEKQVGAVVLGCTGMHQSIQGVRNKLREVACPVTVIEPLKNGVMYLEHTVRLGYSNALGVLDHADLYG